MSWYRDSSGTIHSRRASIAIDNTGAGAGTIDVSITIPNTWDTFWTEINQTDGRDIRVCDSSGSTLLTYQLVGLNISTRTLSIEIDALSVPAKQTYHVHLYWGNSAAVSAAGSFVAAAPFTGRIATCNPAGYVVRVNRERFQDTRPRAKLAKAADENIYISYDFGSLLNTRPVGEAYANHLQCEEIASVTYTVTQQGIPDGAMIDVTRTRILQGSYVQVYVTGGTTANNYTVTVTVATTENQTFVARQELAVNTPVEG